MACLCITLLLFLLCCQATVLHSATVVNLRAILQGPYIDRTVSPIGKMSIALQITASLPSTDPYGTGVYTENLPENTVDWLLLEFRTAPAAPAMFRQAVLLRNDGTITDVNGALPAFEETDLPSGAYYIIVRHRNHLAVMSAAPVLLSASTPLYDFTTGNEKVYLQFGAEYGGLIQVDTSVWAIPAGDIDSNGVITEWDRDEAKKSSGTLGYVIPDVSLDGIVNAIDRILTRDNTYRYSSVPNIPPATDHSSSPLQILSVAPVPVAVSEQCSAEFSISRPAEIRIELIDITGKSMLLQEGSLYTGCYSLEIPHQALAPGMYYLVFTAEQHQETRRILVIQ